MSKPFGYFWENVDQASGEAVSSGFSRAPMAAGEFQDEVSGYSLRVRALDLAPGLKPYSVVLLRPDYLADADVGGYGHDNYIALVMAEGPWSAIPLAQKEVFSADAAYAPSSPDDYAVAFVLDGHVKVQIFGWQL